MTMHPIFVDADFASVGDALGLGPIDTPCPSCQTLSRWGSDFLPVGELAECGLERLFATRCFHCGAIGLVPALAENADAERIRAELEIWRVALEQVSQDELALAPRG